MKRNYLPYSLCQGIIRKSKDTHKSSIFPLQNVTIVYDKKCHRNLVWMPFLRKEGVIVYKLL